MPIWGLLHSSTEAMEEMAEAYIFGRLGPTKESSYEEHLLVCEKCRESVQTAERFIHVFRAAAGGLATHVVRH